MLGVWLKEKMLNTVANDDLEEFNRTLIEMIAKRAASAGGLTQEVKCHVCVHGHVLF